MVISYLDPLNSISDKAIDLGDKLGRLYNEHTEMRKLLERHKIFLQPYTIPLERLADRSFDKINEDVEAAIKTLNMLTHEDDESVTYISHSVLVSFGQYLKGESLEWQVDGRDELVKAAAPMLRWIADNSFSLSLHLMERRICSRLIGAFFESDELRTAVERMEQYGQEIDKIVQKHKKRTPGPEKKHRESWLARIAAVVFHELTGRRPTISNNVKGHGRFFDFVSDVFAAVGFPKSAVIRAARSIHDKTALPARP